MSSLEVANLFNVRGLVAVITGGGSGIGLMMSKALALNGAHKVFIIGRRKEVLDAAAKESPHGNIIPLTGDVTSKESLKSIVAHIEKEVGYINVLIANSGISGPQSTTITPGAELEEFQSALWNQSLDDYTRTFHVNVSAVFFTIVAFLKLLDAGNKEGNVEQKSQVIATSSIGGFNRKVPAGYAYGESKASTTLLMKQMATNLVPYDIRSNAIAPGLYPSDMAAGLIGDGVFPKETIPAQRSGTPEDMAGVILFLTSRAGAYCNGNVVVTDGGRLSLMPAVY
ncbi:hypothetical protein P7C71_g6488, partial [Lecanoromycetidae sp. Uapishka_2]